MIISGTEFEYPQLGIVHITVRYNSRHISARWRDGKVFLNVPYGVDEEDVHRALIQFTPRLKASRPEILYYDGQVHQFDGLTIVVKRQTHSPAQIITQAQLPQSIIEVGSDFDFNNNDTARSISNMMCRIAQRLAPNILLPRARQLAHAINKTPVGWTITAHVSMSCVINIAEEKNHNLLLNFIPIDGLYIDKILAFVNEIFA